MRSSNRFLWLSLSVVFVLVGCGKSGLGAMKGSPVRKVEQIKCEEGLPQKFCEFVGENRGGVLPDPRSGKFSEFKIAPGRWDSPAGVAVGWVFDADKDGDQFALLGNGMRVKVAEVIKELTLDEKTLMDRIVNFNSQMITFDHQRRDNSHIFRTPVVLIALDRQDLAKVVWKDWEAKFKNYGDQLNQINVKESLLQGFFMDRKLEITNSYREKDWQHGLEVARIYALNVDQEPQSPYTRSPRPDPTPKQIVEDLERRITSKDQPVNIDELAGMETGRRHAELIRGLDGNWESASGQMTGMTLDGYIIQEGAEIVPLLLEDVKNDNRLTLGMDYMVNDFGPMLPITVRNYVATLLPRIWNGMPSNRLADFADPAKARDAADWYLKEWSVQGDLRLSKRIHRNIVDGKLRANELDQAIKQLFEKAGPGSTVPYQAGKTPFNIDELTPVEQGQIGDAIEKSLAEVSSDPQGNHSSAANLIVGLAKIRGKVCLPVLQRYSRDLATMIASDSHGSPLNRYGPAMGAAVSERIALGDGAAAMLDLKQVFGSVNMQDATQIWVLRAAWEFPADKELQAMIEQLLLNSLKGDSEQQQNRIPDFLTSAFADDAWKSPGVRRFVLSQLKNNQGGGVATIDRVNGDSGSYSYKIAGYGGGSTSGQLPKGTKVGAKVSFSLGDYWAQQVGRSIGFDQFSLVDSAERRKVLRSQIIQSLESGKIKGRDGHTGQQYIPVWKP